MEAGTPEFAERYREIIAARRQHIRDMAPCRQCRWPALLCRNLNAKHATKWPDDPMNDADLCGSPGGSQFCNHRDDPDMLTALTDEILAGHVRTVEEAYPPPVQGPKLPSMTWLLEQDTWWAPHRKPMIRLDQMDKPHRFNVARWLMRQAPSLAFRDSMRGIWADAPDDVQAAVEMQIERPQEWLEEQPLYRALRKGLPKEGSRAELLLSTRAVHWHTCPMRLKHPGRLDRCLCVRDGRGRIVGATNDPNPVPVAPRRSSLETYPEPS